MDVTLYTLPTCGICHMIKTKMSERHIDFIEKDLSELSEFTGIDRAPVLRVGAPHDDTCEVIYIMSPTKMVEWINKQ